MFKQLNNFIFSLILLLIYSLCMIIFRLDGVSISKLLLSFLLWISLFIAVKSFIKHYSKVKLFFPRVAFKIFLINIVFNVIAILRSLVFSDGSISTLFGNIFTSLALLGPLFIVFSIDKFNLKKITNYSVMLIKLGLILLPLFYLSSNLNDIIQLRILNYLFLPVIFLITTMHFSKRNNKFLIILSTFLLFVVAIKMSNRTMMIREIMLFLSLLVFYFYNRNHKKAILKLYFLIIFIPFYFISYSISSGESAIQQNLSTVKDDEMSTDTRTFLYVEVFEDLVKNNKLLIGKGANGSYYSDYFSRADGDAETRLTVEVGFLSILLKTGLIGVILYLALMMSAIYHAFFKTNNVYVIGIGLMLSIHVILFFIENIVSYSSYNLFIWFFVGICLSKDFRNMSDAEIKFMFNPKKLY